MNTSIETKNQVKPVITETMILLLPVLMHEREFAEKIEGTHFKTPEDEKIINELPNTCLLYNMSDFMDLCNNQELELENYWITHLKWDNPKNP